MKEVKHYICELCGTTYDDIKEVRKCEEGHKRPVEIIKAYYLPKHLTVSGIPHRITVKMSDGSEYDYER